MREDVIDTKALKDLLAKVTQECKRCSGSGHITVWRDVFDLSIPEDEACPVCAKANATLIALAPTLAAEVVRLRGALQEISLRHIPDQPAAHAGDAADWATRQHTELRRIASQAITP